MSKGEKDSVVKSLLLESNLELIKNYEIIIANMNSENSANLKKLIHDIVNPLQILSMTLESLQDKGPPELVATFEQMKRATDTITEVVNSARRRSINNQPTKTIQNISA